LNRPTPNFVIVLALYTCMMNAGRAQEMLPAPAPVPALNEATMAPPIAITDDLLQGPPPSLVYEDPADGSGFNWVYPWSWVPRDGWTNTAELGINGSSGNANSFSFQAGTRLKRKTDINLFDLRMTHNRTQSNGVEKQNNALLYADFDRYFADSPWTMFVKNGVEYDRFKAFDLRYNVNAGLAYRFIKSENLNLKGRFGSGTSREFGGPEDRWVPEALFGGDYEHQLNKRNKWIARADYYPEWGNFTNYRVVSDASWEMLWDEAGNLSFKIGAIDRYDSTPNGRRPNDLTYSLMLLYKF
jgi:putative salt-induced outer membrane protein YdiY